MCKMRKIGVSLIAVIMTLFCSISAAMAMNVPMLLEYDGGTHEYNGEVYALVVNNQVLDPPLSPIIFNDRALVPVREIFEEVGATVNYINDTQTIEVFYEDSYIRMKINDNVAYINGEKTNIPDNVVPKLIAKVGGETKTMVPVRFISETIGLDVEFDSTDGAILIDSDGYNLSEENQDMNGIISATEVPIQEPVVNTPTETVPVTPIINGVNYTATSNSSIEVTISADNDISDFSDFTLNSPQRVVVDIANAKLGNVSDTITVNTAGITTIRLGVTEERARVVIDVENLKGYEIQTITSNEIKVIVNTEKILTPTPAPVVTPKPTVTPSSPSNNVSDKNKLVVLDAGHGGTDPGAIGYINGNEVLEKNLTLEITYKVKEILENAGYTVSMTRTGDTLPSLVERPTQANEENAAVFVSIHINSVDNAPSANGTEVFYAESNNGSEYGTTSEKLATNILNRMLYYMGSTNRGVKTAEHAVTKRCEMPAALAEVGFITNPTEVYNMTTDEYQQKAAQGIAEGIMITLKDVTVPAN